MKKFNLFLLKCIIGCLFICGSFAVVDEWFTHNIYNYITALIFYIFGNAAIELYADIKKQYEEDNE